MKKTKVKVKRLKKGSNIAVISPSNGLASVFPHIYEMGLKNLSEVFGFNMVEYPTSRMLSKDLYTNPKLRAEDIQSAFQDESIDGIICTIGGYESVRILEYLDMDIIMNHPKFIMGFSDATTFLSYFNKWGLVTFYGPSVMAGLAQMKNMDQSYEKHLKDMLLKNNKSYVYKPYKQYTNGYKDWSDPELVGQCEAFYDNENGFEFYLDDEPSEGELWGGCIEVLEFIKGTKYWPEPDFWYNKVLFFETSEEKPSPMAVGYMLRNYGIQGILNSIKGLLIARPKDYTEEEKEDLKKIVMDIMTLEFNVKDIPIVFNMDFGHTDPKLILPLGCVVRIKPKENCIELVESPYTNKNK